MTKNLSRTTMAVAFLAALGLVTAAWAGPEATYGAIHPPLVLQAPAAPQGPGSNWIDHFDTYTTGMQLHGVGGWEGWGNSLGAGALTSDVQARSLPNSVDINGPSDLTHPYTGYTAGVWTYTAWQYIPSGTSGLTYFIMLNTYNNDPACTGCNWSVQVNFDMATGAIVNDGISGGTGTVVFDQWVPIVVVIDLDANQQTFWYNGTMLYQGTWTEEVSGGGALNIGTVDLFANNAPTVYYDDISLSNLPFLDGFESEDTSQWHFTLP